jgi:hypothetical protein
MKRLVIFDETKHCTQFREKIEIIRNDIRPAQYLQLKLKLKGGMIIK